MQVYVQAKIVLEGERPLAVFSKIGIDFKIDDVSGFSVWIPMESNSDILGFFNKNKDKIGKKVTLILSSGKNNEDHLTFIGLVTSISFSRSDAITPDLLIKAEDPSRILAGTKNTRAFIEKSFEEILDVVLRPYPKSELKIKKLSIRNPWKYDYLVQYNESDLNFLRRICNDTGNWFFYNGKELIFGIPSKENERKVYLGNTLTEFQVHFLTLPYKEKSVIYNYRKSEKGQLESKDSDIKSREQAYVKDLASASGKIFPGTTLNNLGDAFPDQKNLETRAKIIGEKTATSLMVVNGKGRDPGLIPGHYISIFSPLVEDGSGAVPARLDRNTAYGSYMVCSAAYEVKQGGELTSEFTAFSAGAMAPPDQVNIIYPLCETQPAEVVENVDPDGFGRIKVKFFWMESETTPWLRVNSLHAGNEYGFFWMPEVGDQVLVGFEDHNPDKPFIIGGVYHKQSNQKAYQVKNNDIKSFKTRTGNEIKFIDKSGEEEILITSPQGKNKIQLTFKNEVSINVFSENIHLDAKKITITGEDSIAIKSKKITVEAQNEITTKSQKIETSANNSHKISSANSLELKGMTGKLEASTQLELKGGAMAKLEGGAQTVVKGGIVMIN